MTRHGGSRRELVCVNGCYLVLLGFKAFKSTFMSNLVSTCAVGNLVPNQGFAASSYMFGRTNRTTNSKPERGSGSSAHKITVSSKAWGKHREDEILIVAVPGHIPPRPPMKWREILWHLGLPRPPSARSRPTQASRPPHRAWTGRDRSPPLPSRRPCVRGWRR